SRCFMRNRKFPFFHGQARRSSLNRRIPHLSDAKSVSMSPAVQSLAHPEGYAGLDDFDLHGAAMVLGEALKGADDGEIFIEKRETESLLFDDGRLKSSAYGA